MSQKIEKKVDHVVDAIKAGKTKFTDIRSHLGFDVSDFRKADRLVQLARKKGLITYDKGHWRLVGDATEAAK